MSTRPSESGESKLTTSLDDLIKGEKASRIERSDGRGGGGGGPVRRGGTRDRDDRPYARRDGGGRDNARSGGGSDASIFVGNLPWSVDWKILKSHMRDAGEVVRADVASGDDGRSRGFGIVEFANPKAARKAIQMFHETELEGRTIIVREDRGDAGGERRGGSFGSGGRGPPRSRGMAGESEIDPVYSNSGVTGRNGWVRPNPTEFVDEGPPPEPKGSMLR